MKRSLLIITLLAVFPIAASAISITQAFTNCNNTKSVQQASHPTYNYACEYYPGTTSTSTVGYIVLKAYYPTGGSGNISIISFNSGCTSPEEFSLITGICATPAPPCLEGSTKLISIPDVLMPTGGGITVQLHHHKVTADIPTATEGGCVYALPRSGYNNCTYSPTAKSTFCHVIATATGAQDQSGDTAVDPATDPPPTSAADCPTGTTYDTSGTKARCATDKANEDCLRTNMGYEICNSHPKKNCGTFNGVEVCVSPDGTVVPQLDGKPTNNTNSNGQYENCRIATDGTPICINTPTVPKDTCGFPFVCARPDPTPENKNPKYTEVNKSVETKSSTTTTANPDGTTTTTTTTTQNVIDSQPTVTTVTKDSNGNVVSTIITGGQGQVGSGSNGHSVGSGSTFDGNVSDSQTHTLLDSIKASLNGLKDSLTGAGTAPIKPSDGLDDVFSSGQDQLSNSMNTTTGYITKELNMPQTGTCDFPTLTWKGKTTTSTNICSRLDTIKTILGYVLYILTFVAIVELATRGTT